MELLGIPVLVVYQDSAAFRAIQESVVIRDWASQAFRVLEFLGSVGHLALADFLEAADFPVQVDSQVHQDTRAVLGFQAYRDTQVLAGFQDQASQGFLVQAAFQEYRDFQAYQAFQDSVVDQDTADFQESVAIQVSVVSRDLAASVAFLASPVFQG